MESHASRVRKKLSVDREDRFIVNVWESDEGWTGVVGCVLEWLG